MQKEDSWKTLISQQKEVTERIEKEIVRLKSEDFVVENEALREELTKCKTQLAEFKQQVSVLSDENRKLKDSLYEQIYNEKIAILNAVSKKVEAYYHSSVNGEMNRLKMFENDSKHRINNIVNILKLNRIDDQDEIF
jgi:predicted nuclease with TOPRIM domain